MNLVALPAFNDNYIWMLHDGRQAVVVDPGDAAPVFSALDQHGLELIGILVTHHHPDHTGGVNALRDRLRGCIKGPIDARIPQPVEGVRDGESFSLLGVDWEVLHVPGHTLDHVAYVGHARGMSDGASYEVAPILFCGDTLFSAGCGRLFEGTADQMWASLSRLSRLPGSTLVCCAHEYTVSNLRFAAAVEPHNPDIAQHLQACRQLRDENKSTLPSTIDRERRINPFLRCEVEAVVQAAKLQGAVESRPADVLAALRAWKNRFQ